MTRSFYIFLALLLLLFPACSRPEIDPVFSIPEELVSVDYKGGETQVSFVANNDWVASTGAVWLQVSPGSGSARFVNEHTLYLSYEENTGVDRDCYIVIRSHGDEKRIHMRQQHAPLMLDTRQFEVSIDAQLLAIPFTSDGDLTVELDEAGEKWARLVRTRSSLIRDTVWLDISANQSGTRKAEIALTCGGKTETVSVQQDANLVPVDDYFLHRYCLPTLDFNKDGQFCMDDAELVTTIQCYREVESYRDYYYLFNLDGWEYFPHLKTIDVQTRTADNFDFSLYKELEFVAMTAPLQDPDLSANVNLNYLALFGIRGKACLKNLKYLSTLLISGCKELDLEGTTNLQVFDSNNVEVEILDIGPQPLLKTLAVHGTEHLKTINTNQLPALTDVKLTGNYAIETLDLTFQPHLSSLYLLHNPYLKTIYVKRMPDTFYSDTPVTLIVVE